MATPEADGKHGFPGHHADFVHEHALASVQAGSRRLDFLRRWNGDGAALGAAQRRRRAHADVPTRELRMSITGN